MVGRGLRGPKNGGTEEVLIVNMLDNLIEFADSIVYQSVKNNLESERGLGSDRLDGAAFDSRVCQMQTTPHQD